MVVVVGMSKKEVSRSRLTFDELGMGIGGVFVVCRMSWDRSLLWTALNSRLAPWKRGMCRVNGPRSLVGGQLDVVAQPGQALENTLTSSRATGLDFPGMVLGYPCKIQRIRDFFWSHCYPQRSTCKPLSIQYMSAVLTSWNILLVRKHQQQRIFHFAILNNPRQLAPRLVYPVAVVAVNDEDKALGAGEVMSPQRSDLVLPAHVPHVELGVLVGHGLDVEADGGDRGHVGVEFEFVEDCCRTV